MQYGYCGFRISRRRFSNSILEAMAAGRIVIVTDVGDARLQIEDKTGNCGYVVPPKDARALANAVRNAVLEKEEALARSKRAQEVATARFSVEPMVKSYTELYYKIGAKREKSV